MHRGVPYPPRFSEGGTRPEATDFPSGSRHHGVLMEWERKSHRVEGRGIPPLHKTQRWATRQDLGLSRLLRKGLEFVLTVTSYFDESG